MCRRMPTAGPSPEPLCALRQRNLLKVPLLMCGHLIRLRVGVPWRRLRAFISVGAFCQRTRCFTWDGLRWLVVFAVNCRDGSGSSVLRSLASAAGRLNSSLRSHRTWRSHCRHVSSGLDKTMYASVGPNSRCRGHQPAVQAKPWSLAAAWSTAIPGARCWPGRMKGLSRSPTR